MPQTNYDARTAVAFAGLAGDLKPAYKSHKLNEESVAIPFGVFVARGTSENKVLLPAAATDVLVGVVESSFWAENQSLSGSAGVAASGGSMNVIESGTVWMPVEEAMAVGDPVYVRFTSDGGDNTQKGKIRNDADSGRARLVHGAKVAIAAASGSFAMIDIAGLGRESEKVDMALLEHAQNANGGDQQTKMFKTPSDRYFVVTGVDYVNPTGLAAHNDNHAIIALKHGSGPVVAASWNTDGDAVGAEGTITADTTIALTLGSLANRTVPPSTQVFLSVAETGTTTVPAGRIAVKGYWI
jgi:hypothetical protein